MAQRRSSGSSSTAIVVGAGISGLTAAWRLQSAGIDVVVVDKAARPGGRFHSITVNGCTMEAGANFVTDAYRIIPKLAAAVNLKLEHLSSGSAIAIDGQIRAFRASLPPSAVRAGILSLRDAGAAVPGLARFGTRYRRNGTFDPLNWLALDAVPATEWAEELGLHAMLERAWRPAYHGFYFQDTQASSAAAVAAMAQHGLRQHTLTIRGGLSTLTDALAARLEVHTGVTVTEIAQAASEVLVRTDRGDYRADAVVVAVPGPHADGIMALDHYETAVTQVPYSSGLLVGLGLGRRVGRPELQGAYGVLAHPDTGPFAALCVASRAGHVPDSGSSGGSRDVITCMFSDSQAHVLAAQTDAKIIAAARHSLLAWEPTLRDAFVDDDSGDAAPSNTAPSNTAHSNTTPSDRAPSHMAPSNAVIRIPYAMPTSPPGRLSHIAAYRRHAYGRRVILAGDSLAWPWSDSAAFTGMWASNTARRCVAEVACHLEG
ncbi:FAD-dependent oxidoreductase [Actinobaculum sp. 313]|uniref:protoporphyrinogen/coproporphyrinogen oxidase n=1 Tax=Actinobaculum sp. 313 TaxID=2495645 RepID=UPI0013DDADC7|nr:FAD-dependent oxidoreductase [Actinobaculum sp. 313]